VRAVTLLLCLGSVCLGSLGLFSCGDDEPDASSATSLPDAGDANLQWYGSSEEDAVAKAESEGRESRVGRRDSETFPLTEDFVPGRVTFSIDDGTVTFTVIELDQGIEFEGAQDVADTGYLGMTPEEATAAAEADGRAARVIMLDGEGMAVTADFIEDRLNFTVRDGVVTGVTLG
jgi:hypothetical protein